MALLSAQYRGQATAQDSQLALGSGVLSSAANKAHMDAADASGGKSSRGLPSSWQDTRAPWAAAGPSPLPTSEGRDEASRHALFSVYIKVQLCEIRAINLDRNIAFSDS